MHCNFSAGLLERTLPGLLSVEFVLGTLGNGLALWIFCFHLRPWKSSTVLLFNLAVADFLLLTILPFRASYYASGIRWRFGRTLCDASQFMLALNRTGSALFLMAIALDRYVRVLHPHSRLNSLSPSKAACGAAALWLVTVCLTANALSLRNFRGGYCESFLVETSARGNRLWHKFNFLFSCWVPLLVILFCTVRIAIRLRARQLGQRGKVKKALCFLVVVVALFAVCFLPSNVTQLLIWIETRRASERHSGEMMCAAMDNLTVTFYVTVSLTYLNSALDPLVYYFSSPTFKSICRRSLHLPQGETTESTEKRSGTRETASHSCSQI
ncbi:hydroxycarboxylic acid receptor 3 [Corythoichthys intestinalis]|uniref:hydroxycarboxylic acid receptor 3 n=1 Tax=Corythoichthys intestinalis TaxID=161448 RepID=UPI0025A67496|nr:hydroxycarboxylic acid receptor 3 [Corythoichthys intestinalis]XP_061804401.1 hydroxycarboxylic acid receptor 3-like [Nerophis lumbriciformis]